MEDIKSCHKAKHYRYKRNFPDLSKYKYKCLTLALIDEYGTISNAARKIGYSGTAFYDLLKGKISPRKGLIDDIRSALDITYEEMFIEDQEEGGSDG